METHDSALSLSSLAFFFFFFWPFMFEKLVRQNRVLIQFLILNQGEHRLVVVGNREGLQYLSFNTHITDTEIV